MLRDFLSSRAILGAAVFSFLVGCDPIPVKVLTQEQKVADMMWLYSQFDENYAPLEYKSRIYGFDYEKLKNDFMEMAKQSQGNDDFYLVMQNFVAQFRDAHTTASLTHGGLPHRASMAYLGISGKRLGDRYVVTELLPTFDLKKTSFPIRKGDEISMLDGKPLTEVIQKELIPLEDLGQEEANLTFHMNRIFTRLSTTHTFPEKADAQLTIVRREYTAEEKREIESKEDRVVREWEKKEVNITVTVPWVVKDVFDFKAEQKKAQASATSTAEKPATVSTVNLSDFFMLSGKEGSSPITLGLMGFDGNLQLPSVITNMSKRGEKGYHFLKTFYRPNQVESWTADIKLDDKGVPTAANPTPMELLKKVRFVPSDADFITPDNATFPTYVTLEDLRDLEGNVKNREGRAYGKKRIATMYLNTFSPKAGEEDVLKEFQKTLDRLQLYGVNDLVIDLINNGGGSLSLGLQLAQALSNTKIDAPLMQFRTSETWIREFEEMSLDGPSDAEKELAKRVHKQLMEDYEAGHRLSKPLSTETLIPFELKPNEKLKKKMRIVLLVNEMCASMCDIFSGMMQDNRLAVVLGSRTMGAGGNVVSHYSAPNSHLVVRQTESLMLRSDGSYIENVGVQPNIEMNVNLASDRKYRAIREEAVRNLTFVRKAVQPKRDTRGGRFVRNLGSNR